MRIDELAKAAEAVGDEQWHSDGTGTIYLCDVDPFNGPVEDGQEVAEIYLRTDGKDEARQIFVAAASPSTVLELVRRLREAESRPTQAAQDVLTERQRQVESEGWTPEHDDAEHLPGELELAAASYVCADEGDAPPAIWPWSVSWWKPKSRRRNLVKACALALAAIEKYDRAEAKKQGANHAD